MLHAIHYTEKMIAHVCHSCNPRQKNFIRGSEFSAKTALCRKCGHNSEGYTCHVSGNQAYLWDWSHGLHGGRNQDDVPFPESFDPKTTAWIVSASA